MADRGEIDIMEYTGKEPISFSARSMALAMRGRRQVNLVPPGVRRVRDWHTYAIEWDETGI